MPFDAGAAAESPDDDCSQESELEVIRRVLDAPPGGRVRRDFEETLNETGLGRLLRMEQGNHLFSQLREIGIRLPPRPASWHQNSQRLIHEAVYKETRAFLNGKISTWSPSEGLSLANYYVRGCLLRFSNLYKHYVQEEGKDTPMTNDDLALLHENGFRYSNESRSASPELLAECSDSLRRAVQPQTDATNRMILFERAALDRTWRDIAASHGLSVDAANARYRRMQRGDGLPNEQ